MNLNKLKFIYLFIVLVIFAKESMQNRDGLSELLRREHTLIKPYGGSSAGVPFWDFIGSTIVSNKFIRLTSDSQSLQGALWNTIVIFNKLKIHLIKVKFSLLSTLIGKYNFNFKFTVTVKTCLVTGLPCGTQKKKIFLVLFLVTKIFLLVSLCS